MSTDRFDSAMNRHRYRSAMLTVIALLVALLSAEDSFSEEVPANVLQYAKRSSTLRQSHLLRLRQQLVRYKKTLRKVKTAKKKQIRLHIERTEQEILELEDPFHPFFAKQSCESLAVGDLSVIDFKDSQIESTSGDSSLTIKYQELRKTILNRGPIEKGDVIRESRYFYERTFHISGVSNKPFADGELLIIPEVLVVKSVKINSSWSVASLAAFDIEPYSHLFTREQDLRTWTDKSGKHKTEAIYVKYERGQVHLVTPERKTKKVKLSDLSNADKKFVKAQVDREHKVQR